MLVEWGRMGVWRKHAAKREKRDSHLEGKKELHLEAWRKRMEGERCPCTFRLRLVDAIGFGCFPATKERYLPGFLLRYV